MRDKGKQPSGANSGTSATPEDRGRLRLAPKLSEKGRTEATHREQRLAAALRANLRKRKAQRSARRGTSAGAGSPAPGRPPRSKRG